MEGKNVADVRRKFIDWNKTAKELRLLRLDNRNLRRYVCYKLKSEKNGCTSDDCKTCTYEMDCNISQKELAAVFSVSENVVVNWENGKTVPPLEDLLFYSEISGVPLEEIIVFCDD